MPVTARAYPYPADAAVPDVPADIQALADRADAEFVSMTGAAFSVAAPDPLLVGRRIRISASGAGYTSGQVFLDIGTAFVADSSDISGAQPLDSDLTAIAALSTTSFGRGLLALADAAALRIASGSVIGTNVQAWDADLDAIAALATAAYGRSLLTVADAAAGRASLLAPHKNEPIALAALGAGQQKLAKGSLSTTAATVYTVPAGKRLILTSIRSYNGNTGGTGKILAYVNGSADSDAIGRVITDTYAAGAPSMGEVLSCLVGSRTLDSTTNSRSGLSTRPVLNAADTLVMKAESGTPGYTVFGILVDDTDSPATPKRVAKGTLSGTTAQTVYTVPAGKTAIIESIRVTGGGAAPVKISAFIGGSADTDCVGQVQVDTLTAGFPHIGEALAAMSGSRSMDTGGEAFMNTRISLNAGETLVLKGSIAGTHGFNVSAIEVT